ncbi:MAG: PAS domain S-box protein [Planctomycetaceae bacterium]|nr:PAS domain S-box protein [Planctomycetaceae bacterium]
MGTRTGQSSSAMQLQHRSSAGGQRDLIAYGVALVAAVGGALVRLAFDPLFGDRFPFLFAFLLSLFVARYVGRGPALFTLLTSTAAVVWLITEPRYSFRIELREQQVGMCLNLIVGWIAIRLIDAVVAERQAIEVDRARLRQEVAARQTAELRAREAADRAQFVADGVPALISYIDTEGRYRLNNHTYKDWFGQSPAAIAGLHVRDVLGESAWDRLRPYMEAALRGETVEYETEVAYRDGGTRWIKASYTPDVAEDCSVRGFVAHVIDISDQKRIEQALHENEARFRRAADGADAMVYELDLPADDGREIVTHTYGVEHIVGSEQLPAELTSRWWHTRIHPDDLPRHLAEMRSAITDPGSTAYRTGYRVRRGDDSWRYVEDVGQIVRRPDGRARRLAGTILDVTDRTIAETALLASEQRFRDLAETVPSIVWTADPSGALTYVNSRWLEYCGLSAEDNARCWPDVGLHPDDRDRCLSAWNKTLHEGADFQVEVRHRRHDGEYRWFVSKALPQRDDAGRVAAWFGVTTDIHGQKELEGQLRDADRRKDEFLATLAHELRNPLAPIRAALDLLRVQGDEQNFQQARDVMERQVVHMVRLIDDLLDVSRINRNKLKLRKDRVELAAAVQQAVENCRTHWEPVGHRLHVEMPADPIVVLADPVRLAQILGNLLTNACKYTPPGGDIRLSVQGLENTAVITIRDSGVGIPDEMLPRVFEMFTQVDRSLERADGGLGIGLSLVKRLVELHEGTVTASSAGPGRGAEFCVRLPLEHNAEVRRAFPPAAPSRPATARRILLVDDNLDAARMLSMLLSVAGHKTHVVHDGTEALEVAAEFGPDLILLDLGLPKLDGFEVCRAIRATPWGVSTAIVALTGWGQDSDRRKSAAAGFNAHLVKPVDFATLNRLIADLGERGPVPETFTPLEQDDAIAHSLAGKS